MTRPLRIDLEDGWYHVTARGNERKPIYRDDRDRSHFLELVEAMVATYQVRLHAYVLMTNHYHLLVQTPRANLSAAMQWLNVSYSIWFNKRHRRAGHLFQGRFTGIVVDGGAWALPLSRYVHLNPVCVGRLGLSKAQQRERRAGVGGKTDAETVRERIRRLRSYRWSSYRAYVGWEKAPPGLRVQEVLEMLGGRRGRRQRVAYRRQVEEAVREGLPESPWEELEAGVALGREEFVERIRARLEGDEKEQPSLRRLKGRPRFEQVKEWVEKAKGEKWETFRDRKGDWGRDLALYLGRKRCGMPLGELGTAVGGIGSNSVGMAVRRFEARLREDGKLKQLAAKAKEDLCNVQM